MIEAEEHVSLKLANGEEIVSKVELSGSRSLALLSPLKVERMVSADGQNIYFTLRSWFCQQFEDHEESVIEIENNQIIAYFTPRAEMVKQYESTLKYLLSDKEDMFEEDIDDNVITGQFPDPDKLH